MSKRYVGMHELARHTIHIVEVLQAACKTLKSIIGGHQEYCGSSDASSSDIHGTVQNDLKFHKLLLKNLRLRAAAFEQRLQNEILLVKRPN